ncbi:MAG: rRNA ((1498)-N(3))-methyltransferase [Oscillospiraceae bacterium]|jgi:16S rRNA (uracil1498-N3)-methyltransferase|nr:rRNA ((1498)-N(3))-methyltransferase [Oscillospiraceae bacterium]
MPRFFVDDLSETVVITGEDARHISKSLRMTAGEPLTLCNGKGQEAKGVIVSLSPDAVSVRLGEAASCIAEPQTQVSLYLAMPKGDKLDLVVQKAVELGAAEIVLFLSSRCISRPKGDDVVKKLQRLQKIANEAAKQCGRGILPPVRGILSFNQAIKEVQQFSSCFVLYEGVCESLRAQLPRPGTSLALLIGSEGGFSVEEIMQANESGIHTASLGKRILRCETAPIVALAAVMFALGEMD